MRVLIVEDESDAAGTVKRALEESGIGADWSRDAHEALVAVQGTHFDVVVLDVMLGYGPDGFAVCHEIRSRRIDTRVLMLTARDAVADRVAGLEAGADDYLGKPFALQELLARVRALGRRHIVDRVPLITVNGVRLDGAARSVTLEGTQLDTTRREFQILEMLMSNAGNFLTKEQIHDHVWSYDVTPESNLVEVYVARLRRKLEAARPGGYITTRRNVGYRFNTGRDR